MNDIREIIRYLKLGVSERETAEALGVARRTVGRYGELANEQGWLSSESALPDETTIAQTLMLFNKTGDHVVSRFGPYSEQIKVWRSAGVSILEICRRLNEDLHVVCSYAPVWHFVTKLEGRGREVVMRVETEAGEEGQVDFGYAGKMWDPVTKRSRKAWLFVMTLGYSRHQFVRFVFDQTVETWLECHTRAFEFLGGVPKRIKLDNLRAAVVKASLYDPLIQRSYRECAEYYGFLISPCRVATPQHKGKVEAGVKYVCSSFLPGRDYNNSVCDVTKANVDVIGWITQIAGIRIHGTTKRKPLEVFEAHERNALLPLPETTFEPAQWTELKCHRDGYVVYGGSYYSVPGEHVGEIMSVRITAKKIELHANHTRVATHSRADMPGSRTTNSAHLDPQKVKGMRSFSTCLAQAQSIGPNTTTVIEELLGDKVVDRSKAAAGLIRLTEIHSPELLERACQRAIELGDMTSLTVRNMIEVCKKNAPSTAQLGGGIPQPVFARSAQELCHEL
jgi:hypothetical protein